MTSRRLLGAQPHDQRLLLIIRRNVKPAEVTSAARDAYLARMRTPKRLPGHEPLPQSCLEPVAARTLFANTFPAFDWIMPGEDGEVWVSEFRYQYRTRPYGEQTPPSDITRRNAFAGTGAWIDAIDLPARWCGTGDALPIASPVKWVAFPVPRVRARWSAGGS